MRPYMVEGRLPIAPQELEKVLSLDRITLIVGLGEIFGERHWPLITKAASTDLRLHPELEWKLSAYYAVSSLLDLKEPMDQPTYRSQMTQALHHMRFLAFPTRILQAQSIEETASRVGLMLDGERLERETGIISLQKRTNAQVAQLAKEDAVRAEAERNPFFQKLKKHNEFLRGKLKEAEEKIDKMLGIDPDKEDRAMLKLLDALERRYPRFPTQKAMLDNLAKSEKLWADITCPESEIESRLNELP